MRLKLKTLLRHIIKLSRMTQDHQVFAGGSELVTPGDFSVLTAGDK